MESESKFARIGGTATGGGTFWGLGSLLTKAKVSSSTGRDKQNFQRVEIMNVFLSVNFNMCFGCSKEPSQNSPFL